MDFNLLLILIVVGLSIISVLIDYHKDHGNFLDNDLNALGSVFIIVLAFINEVLLKELSITYMLYSILIFSLIFSYCSYTRALKHHSS